MNSRAQARLLPDGKRLHLQDGPIDIVLQGFGEADQVQQAYRAAADRFASILDELCSELPLLRDQARFGGREPQGMIARRMFAAVLPYAEREFITPMAAVAGAVAEEVLGAMIESAHLQRAYVNDGGDIALHLAKGESFSIGLVDSPGRPSLFGTMILDSPQPVRGIATSGWRGRSFSLGIADAVTVLAKTAAMADAAATIVANAVDLLRHIGIARVPARELAPDSDLGDRLVTTGVCRLSSGEIDQALSGGATCAESLVASGLLYAAALHVQGTTRVVSPTVLPQLNDSPVERSLVNA
jgi:ApbE superfamily uncharacterized protein (UPF0280 family)